MTNKTDLPTTKTLSTEEMKAVSGGLTFRRRSLRPRSTTSSRFGSFGIISMNFTSPTTFGLTGAKNHVIGKPVRTDRPGVYS